LKTVADDAVVVAVSGRLDEGSTAMYKLAPTEKMMICDAVVGLIEERLGSRLNRAVVGAGVVVSAVVAKRAPPDPTAT